LTAAADAAGGDPGGISGIGKGKGVGGQHARYVRGGKRQPEADHAGSSAGGNDAVGAAEGGQERN